MASTTNTILLSSNFLLSSSSPKTPKSLRTRFVIPKSILNNQSNSSKHLSFQSKATLAALLFSSITTPQALALDTNPPPSSPPQNPLRDQLIEQNSLKNSRFSPNKMS
ncbi:hypothetical protein L6452_13925 [Arctium lappa]|uniref:Uncharacterized protein n=1 Tax=Arctium lappa TaxID=4217 RepID=A0ACB9CJN7_ARCLA|nr:hypothetical protein L6452_13925 [Arctium lappa]